MNDDPGRPGPIDHDGIPDHEGPLDHDDLEAPDGLADGLAIDQVTLEHSRGRYRTHLLVANGKLAWQEGQEAKVIALTGIRSWERRQLRTLPGTFMGVAGGFALVLLLMNVILGFGALILVGGLYLLWRRPGLVIDHDEAGELRIRARHADLDALGVVLGQRNPGQARGVQEEYLGHGPTHSPGTVGNRKYCPQCGSADVHVTLPQTWSRYHCTDCDYEGALVLEDEGLARAVAGGEPKGGNDP